MQIIIQLKKKAVLSEVQIYCIDKNQSYIWVKLKGSHNNQIQEDFKSMYNSPPIDLKADQ